MEKLLAALGYRPPPRLTFEVDQQLIESLHSLAQRDQRPQDEVAADLLSFALAQRAQAETSLRAWQSLSERERHITALTCLGCTNRQIAAELHISPETVKSHLRNILRKFNLSSKAALRTALTDWDFSAWGGPSG